MWSTLSFWSADSSSISRSRPDAGSAFSVDLAFVTGPAIADLPTDEGAEAGSHGDTPRRGRTILYIEDNLSNLRLVETALGRRAGVPCCRPCRAGSASTSPASTGRT